MKSEKVLLFNQLDCAENHGITGVKQRVASMESSLEKLNQREKKYIAELDTALAQYAELQQQAIDVDHAELIAARQIIRADKECEAAQQLQEFYGKQYDYKMMKQSQVDTDNLLEERIENITISHQLRKKTIIQQTQQPLRKSMHLTER